MEKTRIYIERMKNIGQGSAAQLEPITSEKNVLRKVSHTYVKNNLIFLSLGETLNIVCIYVNTFMNVNTSNNVITGNNLGTPYFTANVIKFLNANCIIRLFRALNAKTYYSICKRLFFFRNLY